MPFRRVFKTSRYRVRPKLRLPRIDDAKFGRAEEKMGFCLGNGAVCSNAIKDNIDDQIDTSGLGFCGEPTHNIPSCSSAENRIRTVIVINEENPVIF